MSGLDNGANLAKLLAYTFTLVNIVKFDVCLNLGEGHLQKYHVESDQGGDDRSNGPSRQNSDSHVNTKGRVSGPRRDQE